MKIVYMGTPEIAAGVLKYILDNSGHEVLAVVTQPDKPNARGNEIIYSDVKKLALERNIPVYQPIKASEEDFVNQLREINPDIIVVTAYGQLLKENILNLPRYGCINVHASLLPKYRGASPIQWAVINGEKETGVTIMYMAKGLDTGDMILAKKLTLAPDETAGSLHDRLMELGGPAVVEALDRIAAGEAVRTPQDDALSNYVSVFKKEMGNLDFTRSAEELERLIRGLIPWPGAFTFIEGRMLKIWKTRISEECIEPGVIRITADNRMLIGCGKGSLELLEIQMEGKKRMAVSDYLRGARITDGAVCRHER